MNKALVVILSAALILSGCTTKQVNDETEIKTGLDKGAVKVIREDEGPTQGGILNLFMLQPDTLNPLFTENPTVRQLSGFVFDSLFIEGEDGTPEKCLVDDFIFSQDGLILDMTLRDNILFHDGQALTTDDVAFTLETIKTSGKSSLYVNHLTTVESVKVIDRLSLRLILRTPDVNLPSKLTFPILARHVFEDWPIKGHDSTMKLIGTGAFKFDAYTDDTVLLIRNDSWWYLEAPDGLSHPIWLDGITFKVFTDESQLMQAFQKQEIDLAYLDEGELESYARREDIFLNRYESNSLEYLVFSAGGKESSPIKQEDFRAALMHYLSGYAEVNPINIGKSAIPAEKSMNRVSVLQALKAIGFTYEEDKNLLVFFRNGAKISVSLSLIYNGVHGDRQAVSQWVTAALFEIGVNVSTETASYSEQQALIKSGKFDMMILGCRIPLFTDMTGALALVKETLGLGEHNSVIMPFYTKYGAVLYHNHIRGPRKPVWKNIYNGWMDWYLVRSNDGD